MAVRGIGSDIVEVSRISRLRESYGNRFLIRVFTRGEIAYCESKEHPEIHFAGRFAAKEAIAKAIYQSGYDKIIPFSNIEILNDTEGRPQVSLLIQIRGNCLVTISHEHSMAIAFAILEY
ncbi:MAG: holo-ACP synthase [Candidatus Marinimicrobia bacterium]|nr:holo-ACP synthase [Candidatus Neomarinimicrobiota bacterium]